jgi:hypothetical protein
MNGRPSVVKQSLLSLALLVVLSASQVASAALIDANVKASTDGPTVRAAIVPFIQQQVANLQKDDPTSQANARDALVAEASGGPQKNASVFYLDSYANELNNQLIPVMKNPNMRVRLNAAITAARVAQAAQTNRLADVARAAIDDQSEAVVIMGLQIARYTIPSLAITAVAPGKDPLIEKVTDYVSAHPTATITQYGYNALSLDLIETARTRPWAAGQWKTALSKVLPAIQTIFRARLNEYQKGVPDDPQQERRAVLILTHPFAWTAQDEKQRQTTLQLILDLMSFASQRAVNAKDNQTRDQLVELISYTASSLKAIGDAPANGVPQLSTAVQPLLKFPRGIAGEPVATAVQGAIQAIRAIPQFNAVKVPPAIRAVAVEIKPTTGPSTEPSILPASATQPSNAGGAGATTRPAGGTAPRTPAGGAAPHAPAGGTAPHAPAGGTAPHTPTTRPAGTPGRPGGATPGGPAHTSAVNALLDLAALMA